VKKGFTLIELLIVVAIIAILAAIAVPNFLEAQVRAKVSRVKNDQRSLATGIESYYVDNNTYPSSSRSSRDPSAAGGNYNSWLPNAPNGATGALYQYPTFCAQPATVAAGAAKIATLTTPVAYITSYFSDPFADFKQATFGYFNDTNGWILFSPGPDTDQGAYTDLGVNYLVETLYTSSVSQPSPQLICYGGTGSNTQTTYDPTNGTVSGGDVWRVKQ
jgi:prepilin-type N-terminal cleavage/methylation domain-containing protein